MRKQSAMDKRNGGKRSEKKKKELREGLERDVSAFLGGGGKVQHVPFGVSSLATERLRPHRDLK